MGNISNEAHIKSNHPSISLEELNKILDQMNKSICKIDQGDILGTGFFCNIPISIQNQCINYCLALITCKHVFDEIKGNVMKLEINKKNQILALDNSRKIYLDKMRDIAIIELRNGDFSNINSLYLDENIFEKHPEYNYKDIYILHYEFGKEAKYSPGIITSFDKALIYNTKLYYNCSTQPGSSGGPILNSKNYKIIGVHKGFDPNKMLNKGIYIKDAIIKFQKWYEKKVKNNVYINNGEDNYNILNQINKEEQLYYSNNNFNNNMLNNINFKNEFNNMNNLNNNNNQINNFNNINNNINNNNINSNNMINKMNFNNDFNNFNNNNNQFNNSNSINNNINNYNINNNNMMINNMNFDNNYNDFNNMNNLNNNKQFNNFININEITNHNNNINNNNIMINNINFDNNYNDFNNMNNLNNNNQFSNFNNINNNINNNHININYNNSNNSINNLNNNNNEQINKIQGYPLILSNQNNSICNMCLENIKNSPAYLCNSCPFILCKKCKENISNNKNNKNVHPHLLELKYNNNNEWICLNCGFQYGSDKSLSLYCSQCNQNFCDICCFSKNEEQKQNFNEDDSNDQEHQHSLINIKINDTCYFCSKKIQNILGYKCEKNDLTLCENCYVKIYIHEDQPNNNIHNHELVPTIRSNWYCNICGRHNIKKISYCCDKCNFDVCYKCYYKIDSQENNDDEDDNDNDNDKDNDDNSFDKGVNKVLKTYKAVGKAINEIDECANQ